MRDMQKMKVREANRFLFIKKEVWMLRSNNNEEKEIE